MKISNNQTILFYFFWMVALSSLYVVVLELSTESSSTSAVILNFSLLKLLELVILFLLSLSLICFATVFQISPSFRLNVLSFFSKQKKFQSLLLYLSISTLIGSLGIITVFEPPILLIKSQTFFQWLTFVSGITSLLLLRNASHAIIQKYRDNHKIFSITFLLAIIIWVIFFVIINNNQASEPGQPTITVIWSQGLVAVWVMLTSEFLKSYINCQKIVSNWISFLVIFSLFLIAGYFWTNIPFRGSYDSVGPFTPGIEWFPHSDSIRFDAAAQTIFIGEGINYRNYVDNPLMVNYVAFLHFLKGGLFSEITSLQVWIFALIPPLVFITGKKLFGFSAGLGGAILYIFRANNILLNTNNHGLSSPKILLSEGILEPLLILFVLVFLYWIQTKANNTKLLIILGGLFGLTALVRANVWYILPTLILMIIFLSSGKKWSRLIECLIIIAAVTCTLLPWMWRSVKTINTPFFMYYKLQANSIYQERSQLINSSISDDSKIRNVSYISNIKIEKHLEPSLIDNKTVDFLIRIAENTFYNFANSTLILPFESQNIATYSGVIFPNLLLIDWSRLESATKYISVFSLICVLATFSVGTTYTLKKNLSGGFPIAVYFAYVTASATAMTRGSRYTQPVEWIFLLMFSGGCSLLFQSFFSNFRQNNEKKFVTIGDVLKNTNFKLIPEKVQKYLLNLGIFVILLISIFLILPDYFGNTRYKNNNKEIFKQELINTFHLTNNNQNNEEIESILSSPNSNINKGRIIYSLPLNGSRIYDQVFFVERPYLQPDGNDMLALNIISTSGGEWIRINLLQQDWPKQSLVWTDALYLGCKQGKITQASYVVFFNEDGSKFLIQSNPKITCD
jgi:hypothetical protein